MVLEQVKMDPLPEVDPNATYEPPTKEQIGEKLNELDKASPKRSGLGGPGLRRHGSGRRIIRVHAGEYVALRRDASGSGCPCLGLLR